MWLSRGPITRVTASTHCGFVFVCFSLHFFALGTIAVWGHLFITRCDCDTNEHLNVMHYQCSIDSLVSSHAAHL